MSSSIHSHSFSYLPTVQETWVQSLGHEDPLEKGMASQSIILAWRIPWTEEPGGQQSMGSQRVRQDWATKKKKERNHIVTKQRQEILGQGRDLGHMFKPGWALPNSVAVKSCSTSLDPVGSLVKLKCWDRWFLNLICNLFSWGYWYLGLM